MTANLVLHLTDSFSSWQRHFVKKHFTPTHTHRFQKFEILGPENAVFMQMISQNTLKVSHFLLKKGSCKHPARSMTVRMIDNTTKTLTTLTRIMLELLSERFLSR